MDPLNPYAPPQRADDPDAGPPEGARRRLAFWLGIAEILVGAGLSLHWCVLSIDSTPAPLVWMMLALIVPSLALTVPGLALLRGSGSTLGWVIQVLPVLFLVWMIQIWWPR